MSQTKREKNKIRKNPCVNYLFLTYIKHTYIYVYNLYTLIYVIVQKTKEVNSTVMYIRSLNILLKGYDGWSRDDKVMVSETVLG